MKKITLLFLLAIVLLFSFAPAFSQTSNMDPKTKKQVLGCIRYMIYDEIIILSHRYLDKATTSADSIKIGQQKITELQAQVKSLCGGTDAPNSFYQEAVEKAKSTENKQVKYYFTTVEQQTELKKVYQRYSRMGIPGN